MTMDSHPVKLIDQNAVAAMYGVCSKTIENWSRDGKIPPPHVNRKNFKRWLYSAVAAHIENMRSEAMAEAAS